MYQLKLHKNLDQQKWDSFAKDKQILMIANELNRAKNWIARGNPEEVTNCYERAIELLDLTISLTAKRNLLRELLRFRDVLCSQYISEEKDALANQKLFNLLLSINKNSYVAVML